MVWRVFGLATNILFVVFVSILMLKMRVPVKGVTGRYVHNAAFWVYVGYWLKTGFSIARVPIWEAAAINHDVVTLAFNISGCLIVSISTISPLQLYLHYRVNGNFTKVQHTNRSKYCTYMVIAYVVAFTITMLLVGVGGIDTKLVLLIWRIWFFVIAALEAFVLLSCVVFISKMTKRGPLDNLRNHFLITLYLRAGIAGVIVIKLITTVHRDLEASFHMFFIFTGLLFYHLRAIGFSLGWLKKLFSQTAQLVVDGDDLKGADSSGVRASMNNSAANNNNNSQSHSRSHKSISNPNQTTRDPHVDPKAVNIDTPTQTVCEPQHETQTIANSDATVTEKQTARTPQDVNEDDHAQDTELLAMNGQHDSNDDGGDVFDENAATNLPDPENGRLSTENPSRENSTSHS